MRYGILADCPLFTKGVNIDIWYAKPEFFSAASMGNIRDFDTANLNKTHTFLGIIGGIAKELDNPEPMDSLFRLLQAENWSPNGEARDIIKRTGASHTSMSVGDMIRIFNATSIVRPFVYFVCMNRGWKKFCPKHFEK